jgi:hypothetical protein
VQKPLVRGLNFFDFSDVCPPPQVKIEAGNEPAVLG